ncbi:MAG: metalloregulator ArsR/SmtB family transcription factor [Candidatus Sumerlaea chitinivorans]|uniref:Transcriptional regulator n=1 Tax=Sumerlaea chitinivorans TaxID=2250252 RepID=A0A2Z4Y441_SUMC1|nr:transcriptional regulator [Candidatus Sumerlaea chitinivorans]MCX7964634.1 metalloregulator ArsR/SmtB family transcription factor [Candidatus Sumerlaea chitinivorans]
MKENSAILIRELAERFAALADETRLRILIRLKQGECNVRTLSEELGVAQPSVSKHLSVLERNGFVTIRRVGTQSLCRLSDPDLMQICALVCDVVSRQVRTRAKAVIGRNLSPFVSQVSSSKRKPIKE